MEAVMAIKGKKDQDNINSNEQKWGKATVAVGWTEVPNI